MKTHGHAWILGVLAGAIALSAVACGTSSAPDEAIVFRAVNTVPAGDLRIFDAADDQDPAMPGVQVSVRLGYAGSAAPTLTVGAETYTASCSAGDECVFEGVTLQGGENELQARAPGSVAAMKLFLRQPDLELFGRREVLGCAQDDLDPAAPGLQTTVVIRGHALPEGSPITVTAAGRTYSTVLVQGEASVEATLPAASAEVTILAEAEVNGETWTAERQQIVQCAGCAIAAVGDLLVDDPATGAIILGLADDEGEGEGIQTSVKVAHRGLAGTRVELWVDGAAVGSVDADEASTVTFPGVSLADGSRLEARCTYQGVEEQMHRAVRVDLEAPPAVNDLACEFYGSWAMCAWTQPEDESSPGGLSSWALRYQVEAGICEASFCDGTDVAGIPLPFQAGAAITALFALPAGDACDASFALKVYDAAGNASAISNVVDMDLCP